VGGQIKNYQVELYSMNRKSQKGYVYVLTNYSLPDVVKIGSSIIGGEQRANQLFTTGLPTPFSLFFEAFADDCRELEALVHERLQDSRLSESREFFSVTPEEARIAIIERILLHTEYEVVRSDEAMLIGFANFAAAKQGITIDDISVRLSSINFSSIEHKPKKFGGFN